MDTELTLIEKTILEKYITEYAEDIRHMDFRYLPEVMLELQAEEGLLRSIEDYRTITQFSKETIEKVFECWSQTEAGEEWFEIILKEQIEKYGQSS